MHYLKAHKFSILLIISSLLFYGGFAYDLQRNDTIKLISLYAGLFFLFYKILQIEKFNFKLLVCFGVLSRLVFMIAIPNLSQDFYRFLWDGQLILNGINPFLYTPDELMAAGEVLFPTAKELYQGMGSLSAGHYSNYPPVSQLFYFLSAFFGQDNLLGSVIFLRLVIIAADIGVLLMARNVLTLLGREKHQAFWYFINPFICIELTGNLHFEGVMIFFFLLALYLLLKEKWVGSAVSIGISIATKLIPLLLLPILFRWLSLSTSGDQLTSERKTKTELHWNLIKPVSYYVLAIIVAIATFIPFLSDELKDNYLHTIGLWFNSFEFNASFYYLIREIGFWYKGYNIIALAGLKMAVVVVVFILLLGLLRKNEKPRTLTASLLFGVSFYLFFTTTLHPWYVVTPLLLSVFTNYKFPVVWSFIVVLSYQAYANPNVEENLWVLSIEYGILFGCFIKEVYLKQPICIK